MVGPEYFFVDLMERRVDFLRPTVGVGSSDFGLLVGRWRDWQRRQATRGSGFNFDKIVIFWWLGTRKGVYNTY